MLNRFASTRWIIRAGILLAGVATLAVACVTEDQPRPKCNDLSDGGTVIEVAEAGFYWGLPTTDAQVLVNTAPAQDRDRLVDPGPTCTNCQQADDYEVLLIHDFEQAFAPTWFNYGEPGVFIAPPQVGPGADNDAGVPEPYWGLQVPALANTPAGERCGSKYALHLVGGPFLSWGGGYASRFVTIRDPGLIEELCPTETLDESITGIGRSPTAINGACGFWITPVAGQPSRRGLDASAYEGVSFWARRNPGTQSSLRIALNDTNTAEGLALEVERAAYEARKADPAAVVDEPACKRVLTCCRHCNELERDALLVEDGAIVGVKRVVEKRCWLPGERPSPELQVIDGTVQFRSYTLVDVPDGGTTKEWMASAWQAPGDLTTGAYKNAFDEWDRDAKLCCPPTMEEEDPMTRLGDPLFGGRECSPYVFNYDYSSGYYCWSPGDPRLPEKNENRCGDAFEASVTVDSEWRFYTVPWSELRRFTPNRAGFDPSGIWSVALFFGQGYLDTYVDDIGFYRKRR